MDVKRATLSGLLLSTHANIKAYYYYYPFGMQMPKRYYPGIDVADGGCRYGYNGKEKDDSGEFGGTVYDYGFRIYNPSIAKFLSVDPLTKKFPELTPYQFASNTPIQAIDWDGLEARYVTEELPNGTTLITITIRIRVKNSTDASEDEVKKWMEEGEKNFEKNYRGYDPKTKTRYRTDVQMVRDPNLDDKDIWGHSYYIEFVNEIMEEGSLKQGKADKVGDTEINRARIVPFEYDGYIAPDIGKLISHEEGHKLGLRHPKYMDNENDLDIDQKNIMDYNNGADVTIEQLKRIVETIDATQAKYDTNKEALFKNTAKRKSNNGAKRE